MLTTDGNRLVTYQRLVIACSWKVKTEQFSLLASDLAVRRRRRVTVEAPSSHHRVIFILLIPPNNVPVELVLFRKCGVFVLNWTKFKSPKLFHSNQFESRLFQTVRCFRAPSNRWNGFSIRMLDVCRLVWQRCPLCFWNSRGFRGSIFADQMKPPPERWK